MGKNYGHFSDDGKEFIITDPRTPLPWFNYMWNGRYAGLISHTSGGFSYIDSPRDNRLTRMRYNCLPWDQPGRYVYLRDAETGGFWSLSWAPTTSVQYDRYLCRHGLGYTTIETEVDGIESEITYFVPREINAEVWLVKLKNKSSRPRRLDVFSYAELMLGNALNDLINQPNDKHFSDVSFDSELNVLSATRRYWVTNKGASVVQPNQSWPCFLLFGTSLNVKGFDGSRDRFIGNWRSESNPAAVGNGACFNTEITAGDPCAALQCELALEAGTVAEFTVYMALVDKPNLDSNDRLNPGMPVYKEARELARQFRDLGFVHQHLDEVHRYWIEYLSHVRVETPDLEFNTMLNVWNRYQTAVTFDMNRNSGYYHGGLLFGTGIRDQMQDLWGPVIAEPKRVRARILEVASYQFSDGSTLHNYFRLTDTGEKTGHSDTPLWLPFGINNYLKETGDFSVLDEVVRFYDKGSARIIDHYAKAIDYTIKNLTRRNLPKFGPGDWNDTLDYVGRKGNGETIWGAGFLCFVLVEAQKLMSHLGKRKKQSFYKSVYDRIAAAVNKYAWDGKWYVRGFKDDGNPIGSKKNKEGKIFTNAQSWLVISGIAPAERALLSMESVKKHLDTPKGVMILAPAYMKVDRTIGLATRCVPGKKENGAIFNHASSWAVLAELVLKHGNRAYEIYRRMLPPVVGQDQDVYRTEPYVYSEYVTSPSHPTYGEASHSWLTGSAVWMLRNAYDRILGVRPELDGLVIDPCVPSAWREFSFTRTLRGAVVELHAENPNGSEHGVEFIEVNGERREEGFIPYDDPAWKKKLMRVRVRMK